MTGTECCRAAMTIMGAGADSNEYYAQFALGQQHRGHRLVLPFRRFFFAFHYSTVPPSFERETIS